MPKTVSIGAEYQDAWELMGLHLSIFEAYLPSSSMVDTAPGRPIDISSRMREVCILNRSKWRNVDGRQSS